jgi:hypothetical protein
MLGIYLATGTVTTGPAGPAVKPAHNPPTKPEAAPPAVPAAVFQPICDAMQPA